MKNPITLSHGRTRRARASAVAVIAASLLLTAGYAQGTSAPTPTTGGSSTNPQPGGPDHTAGTSTAQTASTTTVRGAQSGEELQRTEKQFISQVAKSSPKEVAIAHLAAERASNPQVKSYAQQIISDHQQMHQDLQRVARNKGMTLENQMALSSPTATTTAASGTTRSNTTTSTGAGASGMTASTTATGSASAVVPEEIKSDRHYRSLAQKSGTEFDKEFVRMMVDDHEKDLKLFREQADNADDADVREFAKRHVAVLQGHLDRAETLSQSVAE